MIKYFNFYICRWNHIYFFDQILVFGIDFVILYFNYILRSLIDLNRAGTGLMELVFEPDLCNGLEASALVKELLLIFERIKTCSGRMEGNIV